MSAPGRPHLRVVRKTARLTQQRVLIALNLYTEPCPARRLAELVDCSHKHIQRHLKVLEGQGQAQVVRTDGGQALGWVRLRPTPAHPDGEDT